MELSILSSSLHNFPARRPGQCVGPRLPIRRNSVVFASKRDTYGWDYGGGLVDENMLVLRKRIHEMKLAERNYEPPSNWPEWEKQCYANYDAYICEALGLLQTLLMNTRPSLAIGMVALLALSVPTSVTLVSLQLVEALKALVSGMQLG